MTSDQQPTLIDRIRCIVTGHVTPEGFVPKEPGGEQQGAGKVECDRCSEEYKI